MKLHPPSRLSTGGQLRRTLTSSGCRHPARHAPEGRRTTSRRTRIAAAWSRDRSVRNRSAFALDACSPASTGTERATRLTDRDPRTRWPVAVPRRSLLGTPAAAAVGRTPAGDPDETFLASGPGFVAVSRVHLVVRHQRAPRHRRGDAQREPPAPATVPHQPGR